MQILNRTLLTILFIGASAWSKGKLEIINEAFVENEIVQKDGKTIKKLVPATKVIPGDEVIFVITYRNVGKEEATDIVISNPIPKHMVYKAAESEKSDIKTVFSVDGGKKYGDLGALKVSDKLRKVRPALPDDVTNVQWKLASNLMPSEEGKIQLRAVLK